MTMVARRGLLSAIIFCLGLTACAVSSPPIRYLQLSVGDAPMPDSDGARVFIDAVVLPDFLLRNELLLRDSAYTVRYRVDRRWAEPLDMGIQRVLAQRLASTLDTRRVALFPTPRWRDPYWELAVNVRSFEVRADRAVLAASGTWTRRADNQSTAQRLHVDFEDSAGLDGSEAGAAVALSNLLWQFADALAAPLEQQRVDVP